MTSTTNERTTQTYVESEQAARDAATRALADRGILRPEELLAFTTPANILAWCRWWDAQHGVRKELLADRVRSGETAPALKTATAASQADYGDRVRDWLVSKMPDVCRVNVKVVDAHRRLYGDELADQLAAVTSPHIAAIAAVLRLHYQVGRLTVKEHGAEIRAAVREWDRRAIEDCEALQAARETAGAVA